MRNEKGNDITWSPASLRDLNEIGDYSAVAHTTSKAEEFLESIRTAGNGLAGLPRLWRVREDMGDIRLFPTPPYFICYRVQGSVVEIVRVVHERRDVAALLRRPRV